ncbi:MAG: hypothetical protein R3264_06965, partial [Anaerolineae bacterium]|nr:hypothetical protein [Anaerolineae bacterium]
MTAEIKTVIGQLNIVDGNWRSDTPNQVAVRGPKAAGSLGAGKGDLFILTEVHGSVFQQEAVEQKLAEAIRDSYYVSGGAVTASLRRAMQATNQELYRHNQQVNNDEKILAGAVAVVLRHDEVFIAQIGPTALFAVLDSLIRCYPAQSLWLDDSPNPKEPALGLNPIIEPNLHHLQVSPGDMLILADRRLASHLSLNEVVNAVIPGKVKATIKNLAAYTENHDGSALTLAILEAENSALARLKQSASPQLGRFLAGDRGKFGSREKQLRTASLTTSSPKAHPGGGPNDTVSPAVEAPNPKSIKGGSKLNWLPKLPNLAPVPRWIGGLFTARTQPEAGRSQAGPAAGAGPDSAKREAVEPSPAADPSRYEEMYEPEPEVEVEHGARMMGSVAHDPGFRAGYSPDASLRQNVFSFGRVFRWVTAGLLLFVALLGSGLKNILRLVLPAGDEQTPRQAGAQAFNQSSAGTWTLLRNIVIVIPVIVALIVGINYLQKGRVQEAEYNEFVTSAQARFQQAQAIETDPATAMSLMAEAESFLVEAEAIKGVQPEISTLREQMRQTSDRIGNVQRLYYLPQLRQYIDGGTNLSRIVVQGVEIYVMDSGTNRIFHHRMDDLGETLLPDDESVLLVAQGQRLDNSVVGNMISMTWMPAGGNRQTSDLVVLTGAGLLEYNPNWGITGATLTGQESLVTPVAVSSYFGNFYVLDAQANRLLRYLPTADGYSTPPEDYFPADLPVNLAGAVDLAIDGAIYVLFDDGRISKFQGGQPVNFNVTGLDRPLSNPVSIFTAPDEDVQYLYVADAGNQRIVQFEKDGRFIRQFKPSVGEAVTFANLQDIFVD